MTNDAVTADDRSTEYYDRGSWSIASKRARLMTASVDENIGTVVGSVALSLIGPEEIDDDVEVFTSFGEGGSNLDLALDTSDEVV